MRDIVKPAQIQTALDVRMTLALIANQTLELEELDILLTMEIV